MPFYPQEAFQCGPAALAGVLGAAGVETDPVALAQQVYLPGRQGSLQAELLAATRRAGRIPYPIAAAPDALLDQLRAGRPVLVLQNLQTRHYPAWHYAVVIGFDAAANLLYLNSGRTRALAVEAPVFLRTWDWAGRWGIVVLRPGELPAQADAQEYIMAVADFEAVAGTAAAAPAWQAALRTWPREAAPYLALGNHAYAAGDLPLAVDYYRRGLHARGTDPALGNNLASVLGELGCPRAGLAVLAPLPQTLAPDSDWHAVFEATRAELEAMLTAAPDAPSCSAAGH